MTDLAASLQINASPSDLAICQRLLERQISFWYDELDEIVVSVESRKSKGRFGQNFDANRADLLDLIHDLHARYSKLRCHFIDYREDRRRALADAFFGTDWIPDKDFTGGPFYCYFDGIDQCRNRFVLHLDSDMILGGKPRTWLRNAIELLTAEPTCLIINPLAGPPSMSFELRQRYVARRGRYKFLFNNMSTRVFLIDKQKLSGFRIPLKRMPSTLRNSTWMIKNRFAQTYERPEALISAMMQNNKLFRIDYWGDNDVDGCFTLHPLIKPEAFIKAIPDILRRIDNRDIPEGQRGNHNICNELFDFLPYAKAFQRWV